MLSQEGLISENRGVSREELEEGFRKASKRPEGFYTVIFESTDFLDFQKPESIILDRVSAGAHVFHLVRSNRPSIQFFYSSPGTGTRVAEIDLKEITPCDKIMIRLVWSPSKIELQFKTGKQKEFLSAVGVKSSTQFHVGRDGKVYEIGGEGVEVSSNWLYIGDQLVLVPTAIEFWDDSVRVVELLLSGESKEGYIYEVAVASLVLSTVVTGFEAYTKRRFIELESEGISANTNALIKRFLSKEEIKTGLDRDIKLESEKIEKPVSVYLAEKGRINFQNYDACKTAYGKAYGLYFGNIGLNSKILAPLQRYIRYRHRVVHVSPLIPFLDNPRESKELVRPNRELALEVLTCFKSFIEHLHRATLELR